MRYTRNDRYAECGGFNFQSRDLTQRDHLSKVVQQFVLDERLASGNIAKMSLPPLHTLEEIAEYLHLKPKSLRDLSSKRNISD
jgi:hypothetical protein